MDANAAIILSIIFVSLISEYEEAGGKRHENVIIDSLLIQLSDDKYKTIKIFLQEKDM